jgi:hypothetical protein
VFLVDFSCGEHSGGGGVHVCVWGGGGGGIFFLFFFCFLFVSVFKKILSGGYIIHISDT